jgi:hypothetical protein
MRAVVEKAVFTGSESVIADLVIAQSDLEAAGSIRIFETAIDHNSTELRTEIKLAAN